MADVEKDAKKEEKKLKKKREKESTDNPMMPEEEEKLSSKILLVVITLLIILIWLGIIGLLIKMDFGGFGSSVLYPVLKDVPYVNKILPVNEDELIPTTEVDTQYQFGSVGEAVDRIKELEIQLSDALNQKAQLEQQIEELNLQIADLSVYKEEQANFELEKEKFYEEVVFGDNAPDIEEYKTFYESIDPENAKVLYKQVVQQTLKNESLTDYVNTYADMKPKEAAAIFDTMTDNLQLVADILSAMNADSRADILGKMNSETAAKVTEIMNPGN